MGAENESALVQMRYMDRRVCRFSSAMVTRFFGRPGSRGRRRNEAIDMLLGTSPARVWFAVLDDNGRVCRIVNQE